MGISSAAIVVPPESMTRVSFLRRRPRIIPHALVALLSVQLREPARDALLRPVRRRAGRAMSSLRRRSPARLSLLRPLRQESSRAGAAASGFRSSRLHAEASRRQDFEVALGAGG